MDRRELAGISRPARLAWLLCFALLLLGYTALKEPKHNWDMIGYVASAYSYLGLEGAELHQATYADVRAATDDARFAELTASTDYRRTVHQDPVALEQQAQYRTRVVYVLATLLTSLFTETLSAATYYVSVTAAVLTLLLLGGLLLRERLAVFLLFPFALAAANLTALARYSTPDMLAAMVATAIVCLGLRRPRLAMALLPLLPATRTDYIILAPLLAWALYQRRHRFELAAVLLVAGGAYLAINHFFGAPGYLTMFNFALIQDYPPYQASIVASSNPSDYLAAYATGLQTLASQSAAWVILLGALLALRPLIARDRSFTRCSLEGFTLASAAFALLHFALYPAGHYRFYFAATGLALAMIFTTLSRHLPCRQDPTG